MPHTHEARAAVPVNRRHFIALSAGAAAAAAAGCATNPVTGRSQFMLVSESQEIAMDREAAPHQFSAHCGAARPAAVNAYVSGVGAAMCARTHRPQMPYSFRVVNAPEINAYTFPAGSVAVTRGMMLAMDSEAELAGVLGHELGHVNARHAAQRMTKGMVASSVVAAVAGAVAVGDSRYAALAAGLGGAGAGLLLARYSRDNEREADALGMEYMVRAGHTPAGMVGIMEILRGLSRNSPGLMERMFASHPMSDERYQTAVQTMRTRYGDAEALPANRERYMDATAALRKDKAAVERMQQGELALYAKDGAKAKGLFAEALALAPDDYAGLLSMAKCCLALKQADEARRYSLAAEAAYPGEPQALHVTGMIDLQQKRFEEAHSRFARYKQALPGNPNTVFLNGFALEGLGRKADSAAEYTAFLKDVQEGEFAQHAYQRLVEWGYVKPQAPAAQGG